MRLHQMMTLVLCLVPPATAQDRLKPEPTPPIPSAVFLSDLHDAYRSVSAEEVTLRVQTPSGDRADTFTIRIDPGAGPEAPEHGDRPRSVLLELGQLRIHLAAGMLTAINTAAPDKFYQRAFAGPITPNRLADLLPPLPLLQLAIVNPEDPGLATPLELLRRTTWSDALVDEASRPLTITMKGTSPSGRISLTALVSTVRLVKALVTVQRPDGEAQMDFTIRPVDPGDPATWALAIEGRQPVGSLTELRTTPKPMPPIMAPPADPVATSSPPGM